MSNGNLIDKELIFLNVDVRDKEEVFKFISTELLKRDYVLENYYSKLIEREENYPTGLQLEQIGVAIPHTDAEFAKANKFVVVQLKNEVMFKNMDDFNDVEVGLVIGLVFSDKNSHIDNLTRLSGILQNEELIGQMRNLEDKDKIFNILSEEFKK